MGGTCRISGRSAVGQGWTGLHDTSCFTGVPFQTCLIFKLVWNSLRPPSAAEPLGSKQLGPRVPKKAPTGIPRFSLCIQQDGIHKVRRWRGFGRQAQSSHERLAVSISCEYYSFYCYQHHSWHGCRRFRVSGFRFGMLRLGAKACLECRRLTIQNVGRGYHRASKHSSFYRTSSPRHSLFQRRSSSSAAACRKGTFDAFS